MIKWHFQICFAVLLILIAVVLLRTTWFSVVLAFLPLQNYSGAIEVSVAQWGTSRGLANVQVIVAPVRTGPLIPSPDRVRTGVSDAAGKVRFTNVSPGRYLIHAERNGYLAPGSQAGHWVVSGRNELVTVSQGQPSVEANFSLLPAAVIKGQLLEEGGKAVSGASVYLYEKAVSTLIPVQSTLTNSRGLYEIANIAPGQYYLASLPPLSAFDSRRQTILANTFYPRADDPSFAVPITIEAGAELNPLDFHLVRQPAVIVQGKLVNYLPQSNRANGGSAAAFYAIPKHQGDLKVAGTPKQLSSRFNRASGQFELPPLPIGEYDLVTVVDYFNENGTRSLFPVIQRLTLQDRAITPITVEVRPGSPFKVSLKGDGLQSTQSLSLRLKSLESWPDVFEIAAVFDAQRTEDGSFFFPNVPRGRYAFEVSGLPNGSIRPNPLPLDGEVFIDERLNTLEIVIPSQGRPIIRR